MSSCFGALLISTEATLHSYLNLQENARIITLNRPENLPSGHLFCLHVHCPTSCEVI